MVCFHAVVNAALFVHVNVISVYGEQIQFQIVKCHTVGFSKMKVQFCTFLPITAKNHGFKMFLSKTNFIKIQFIVLTSVIIFCIYPRCSQQCLGADFFTLGVSCLMFNEKRHTDFAQSFSFKWTTGCQFQLKQIKEINICIYC